MYFVHAHFSFAHYIYVHHIYAHFIYGHFISANVSCTFFMHNSFPAAQFSCSCICSIFMHLFICTFLCAYFCAHFSSAHFIYSHLGTFYAHFCHAWLKVLSCAFYIIHRFTCFTFYVQFLCGVFYVGCLSTSSVCNSERVHKSFFIRFEQRMCDCVGQKPNSFKDSFSQKHISVWHLMCSI